MKLQAGMGKVYEIHRYVGDEFQYVVARTAKHTEGQVASDAEKMNAILSPEMRAQGIRYVFAVGTSDSMSRKAGEKRKKAADPKAPA